MIQVVLITRTGKAYLANGIAAFTLDKEAYTPYSQLTATVYGNCLLYTSPSPRDTR